MGREGELDEFTFSHRRFQEYFATTYVIGDPDRIAPDRLLLDARWRETAVVLLQTGRKASTEKLITAAIKTLTLDASMTSQNVADYTWRKGLLHVLGVLQQGSVAAPDRLTPMLRNVAGDVLCEAFYRGSRLDKRWALEVAGCASEEVLVKLVTDALNLESQWINDVVYRQLALLPRFPNTVLVWVRGALLRFAFDRDAGASAAAVRVYLSRLPAAKELLSTFQLARWIGPIDAMLALAAAIMWGIGFGWWGPLFLGVIVLVILDWIIRALRESDIGPVMSGLKVLVAVETPILLVMSEVTLSDRVDTPGLATVAGMGIVTLYCLTWHEAAVYCARHGLFVRRALWPFVHLGVVGSSLQIVKSIVARMREMTLESVLGVFLAFIIIACVVWVFGYLVENNYFNVVYRYRFWLGVILGCIAVLLTAVALLRDYALFRAMQRRGTEISAEEIVELYSRFTTRWAEMRYIRWCGSGVTKGSTPFDGEKLEVLAQYIDQRRHASWSVRRNGNASAFLWVLRAWSLVVLRRWGAGDNTQVDSVYIIIDDILRKTQR